MKVRILESAFDDLAEGADFYDCCEPGIGRYFLDFLLADIDLLPLHAGIHRVTRGYHRALSKRFPYAIYYKVEDGSVLAWLARQLRKRE